MMETALEVRNLSIDYKILKKISVVKSVFHKKADKEKFFRAVKNISFDVEKGEILGIIGKNGSGKSTMLRSIAGIFKPDEGEIDLKGNSVSLMSIGVGFNDQVSGRENIILSGMLLGFSKEEMLQKMDAIVEFAEIGEFIDMPVKTYSSGMYSKLAFAITANLETDIILVDEVLSVGDAKFKKKSYSKMKSLITDSHKTVVMVSHDLNTIKELCNKVLWIHDGELKRLGKPEEVITEYNEFMNH